MSGMLPDAIDILDPDEKTRYIELLTVLANADGALVREEMAALEAFMGRAMLRPEEREIVRRALRNPPDFEDVVENISEHTLRLALRDSVLLAAADGEYHPQEIVVLERMANLADIDIDVLDELYDWVTEGWTWLARGRRLLNIEIPGDELLLGEPDSD
ncbi:MAG: hypothetical protein CXX72_01920 [Methanobacteriota archaeon]|nr:MAG: hypothetical protein CXX72_01920 [Euryarchaeota archaeon]